MTRPGYEPKIYSSQGKHANHYATDAVFIKSKCTLSCNVQKLTVPISSHHVDIDVYRHIKNLYQELVMGKYVRRVWRYQRGNQNLYIEEEQTTQWPKEKEQKDKQRSTKHTHKTKDRVTRTPLKTGDELRCSGRINSSCSTSGPSHVNLVTNLVISHEYGKEREVFTTSVKHGLYSTSHISIYYM